MCRSLSEILAGTCQPFGERGRTLGVLAPLADAQLILAEKLANGRMTMKEILSVRFSQLEGTEPGL